MKREPRLLPRLLLTLAALPFAAAAAAPGKKPSRPTEQAGPGIPMAAPAAPRPDESIDITGQWVAVITEDWRWRMLTPPIGDTTSVPLTPQGIQFAKAWDPARDQAAGEQCRAFGAAGIMRMPTRLRISREGMTLKIETDAGSQTRTLHLDGQAAPADLPRSWQGYSVAEFPLLPVARGFGPAPVARGVTGPIRVSTDHLRAGYLRRNGVPYSEHAMLVEYFDRIDDAGTGASYLVVQSFVTDPEYLVSPFVTSSHFRLEKDRSKWSPRPCEILPPQ
jgi:hypothetical protein